MGSSTTRGTCETSQVLAGVSAGFSLGTHPHIGPSLADEMILKGNTLHKIHLHVSHITFMHVSFICANFRKYTYLITLLHVSDVKPLVLNEIAFCKQSKHFDGTLFKL